MVECIFKCTSTNLHKYHNLDNTTRNKQQVVKSFIIFTLDLEVTNLARNNFPKNALLHSCINAIGEFMPYKRDPKFKQG